MEKDPNELPAYLRIILIVVGFVSLGVGIAGILLPMLPTTPFLVLSAGCFANSSNRFHDWLINNKTFGVYIQNYREGKGVCKKHKLSAVITIWTSITISVLAVPICWLRAFMFLIATSVTFYLQTVPTLEDGC